LESEPLGEMKRFAFPGGGVGLGDGVVLGVAVGVGVGVPGQALVLVEPVASARADSLPAASKAVRPIS
jgi:hypothetical protein